MKICKFVEGSFIPSFDGASQRFSNIAKQLSDLGVDLTIIHCYRGWSNLKEISEQNFRTFAVSSKYYYRDYSVIDKIIGYTKPDIVEMNDMELLMSTGLYINRKFKIPLIYEAHFVSSILVKDVTKNDKAILSERRHEKFVSEFVSGIICFTHIDKNNLLASTKIDPKKIKVIPLGSDFDSIQYRKVSNKNNDILFLGNMYFQPNQEALENIVNEIAPLVFKKNNKAIFKFVGDVPKKLKKKYQNKRIKFLGRVHDINKAFENVRACIAPVKIGGGMRVKILTYMASGIPIISTKIAAEGINYSKFLNIANNPKEFADKIIEIFGDLNKSREQGMLGYLEAKENHSWRKIARKNLLFYKSIIENPVISELNPVKVESEPFWLVETIQKGRFKKIEIDEEKIHVLGYKQHSIIKTDDFDCNKF